MLKFKSVIMRNFLSVGNTPVEIALDDHPITLFTGNSGTGKSTVFLAISFALYGKTPRRIKKTAYVNSINKKNCETTFLFEKDGVSYKVTRGLAPAILNIEVDGVMVEKNAASKDDQEWLEQKFGYNYETFCQTILLSLMSYSPFLTLEAAKRREVVDNIFGLSVFTNMNTVYKRKLAEISEQVKECDSQIDKIDSNIRIIISGIEDARVRAERELAYVEGKIADTKAECVSLKTELTSVTFDESALDDLSARRSELIKQKSEHESKSAWLAQEHKNAKADANAYVKNQANYFTYDDIVAKNKAMETVAKSKREVENEISVTKKSLQKANDSPTTCFACNRPMSDDHIEESKKAIAELEYILKTHSDVLVNLETEYTQLESELANLVKKGFDDAVQTAQAKIDEISERIKKLPDLTSIDSEISQFNTKYNEIQNAKTKKATLETKLAAAVKAGKEFIDMKKRLVDSLSDSSDSKMVEVDAMRKDLEVFKTKKIVLNEKQAEYQIIGKLLKDNGLKAIMMKQYLELTNGLMQKYIELFNLDVKFSFNENFEETIKSRGRDEYEYFSLSSGERMRLDLAMLFTWRDILKIRTGSSVNCLFFDEVFDSSLDADGRAALIPIFESLKDETNVFIISHSPDHLAENDVKHVEVRKVGGFSQYNEAA